MPSPGLIRALRPASGPGIRDDGGVNAGYDGAGLLRLDDREARRLGRHRATTRSRACRARSREYQVLGIRTTIPFFVWLMRQPDYRDGRYDTTWLDRLLECAARRELQRARRATSEQLVTIAAAIDA